MIDWETTDRLYDREEQAGALKEVYQQCIDTANSAVVVITGGSGTGKTALATSTLIPLVEEAEGYFMTGKFEERQCKTIHASASPCFRAFRGLASCIKARGRAYAEMIRENLDQKLGQDIDVLLEMIPELSLLWGVPMNASVGNDLDSSASDHSLSTTAKVPNHYENTGVSMLSIYRRFVQTIIAASEKPLVLHLDDLQWADEWSWSLILAAARINAPGFLLVASCRDSGKDQVLNCLQEATEIHVDLWTKEGLNEMISQRMEQPLEDCTKLAETVFALTKGSPFFSCQYLRQLQEKESIASSSQEEDEDEEEGENDIPSSTVLPKTSSTFQRLTLERQVSTPQEQMLLEIVANQILHLSPETVETLKAASCLGGNFNPTLLEAITGHALLEDDLLARAQQKGLIKQDSSMSHHSFTHDKVLEAAYSLIPKQERPQYHLNIARRLRHELPSEILRKNVAIILHQVQFGLDLVQDPTEREEWAHLALRVSRKACQVCSFASALEHAELGLKLLQERTHWRDQYELTLSMYNAAVDAAHCSGKHERLEQLTEEICRNARSFDDTLQAHNAKLLSLQGQTRTKEGIKHCKFVLKELGEPFPRKASGPRILMELLQTRWALHNMSDDDIMSLRTLTDPIISAKMLLIHQLFPLVQEEHFEYSPLIAFRLVKLTLRYGLGSISK